MSSTVTGHAFAQPSPYRPEAVPDADGALLADTLREAAARGASDIHVEPAERAWRIRLRIDGALHVYLKPPLHLRDAFITRVKVLARMDIAERRVPQDGRLRLALANGEPQD
jgi:type IV pilus assembly protein PilB